MGEIVLLHDPQDKARVLKRIKRLWKEGSVEFSGHAILRMQDRDLDVHDIRNIIDSGWISEISQPHGRWRYKICGKSVEGNSAACVVEVNGKLVLITVLIVTRMRRK